MYSYLIFFHSVFRWLVLVSLVYAVFRACKGFFFHRTFSRTDQAVRHWTATIAHIQLILGFTLYFISPIIRYFWANTKEATQHTELVFFGIVHILCMFIAIIMITIGSALAKRRVTDREKFRTMMNWYLLSLLLIFAAIPWPFSPFAYRPYFTMF